MTPKPDIAPVSPLNLARFLSWIKTLKANPTHYLYGKAGW